LFLPAQYEDPVSAVRQPIFFHGGSRRQMLLGFNYSIYYHNGPTRSANTW